MKVIIIGAGITGCIAAIELSKMQCDVAIYDSAHEIGGILRDVEFRDDYFFNSCQYLNESASWLTNILKENQLDLIGFNHTYGSFTECKEQKIIINDYGGPVFETSDETLQFSHNNLYSASSLNNTLEARFNCYPNFISDFLHDWFKQFELDNINNLHEDAAIATQSSRIYLRGHETFIGDFKKKSTIIDELYGIPKSILYPNEPVLKAFLPSKGYNYFFKQLKDIILKNNCSINLNSPIKPFFNGKGKLGISCRNTNISYDLIIWTGNPVPILFKSGYGKLDNPYCRMNNYYFEWLEDKLILPHYIQVFSVCSPITRIFIYNVNGRNKLTVEAIEPKHGTGNELDKINEKTREILSYFHYRADILFSGTKKQKRHIFYTIKDFNTINLFEKDYTDKFPNFIGGSYLQYGRDQKIHTILNKINAHKIEI